MQKTSLPITVLMAAYNTEKFLHAAIDSILNQSFPEFELLIINDGSTDASGDIIASYRDDRIRCVTNEENMNLCRSLAKGVMLARGEFIARMDADDIAHPTRLEKQLAAMRAQRDLDLLGTNVRWIDENDKVIGHPRVVADPVELRWKVFFRNCFNHPTVMIRKTALERSGLNYGVIPDSIASFLPERMDGIGDEDYLLFGQLCLHGKAGNLDQVLLDYRIHGNSLTSLFSHKQSVQTKRISNALRVMYLQQENDSDVNHSEFLSESPEVVQTATLKQIDALAQKMLEGYIAHSVKRRLETQRRLHRAILLQGQQSLWRRVLVGLGLIFSRAPLKMTDFPLLVRYAFGDKFADLYKRHLRVRSL